MRPLLWIGLAALLLTAAAAYRMLSEVQESREKNRLGDGSDPASYQFDLDPIALPEGSIVAGGLPRDGIESLVYPPVYSVEKARSFHGRSKYVVPSDRVIGVTVNGVSRAYPLQILDWHEMVNDTLGGEPILVTYSPLTDGVGVFSRRIPNGDRVGEFGVSGLLWGGNLLFYDRTETPGEGGESLWSQLLARAVTGPAMGDSLTLLPSQLVAWEDWLARYPATTVMGRDETRLAIYVRRPYNSYFGNDEIRFAAHPLPPRERMRFKEPVVVVDEGGVRRVYPLVTIAENADPRGIWETESGGVPIRFYYRAGDPATAWFERIDGAPSPRARHSFWFAWYFSHPNDPVEFPRTPRT